MNTNLLRHFFWLVTTLLASLFVAGPVFSEAVKNPKTGIVYPDSVAGFNRFSFTSYEEHNPGLGYSYGYRTPSGITATVYAYTAGVRQIPAQSGHPVMTKLREQTMREMTSFAKDRGVQLRAVAREEFSVKTSNGTVSVLVDGFVRSEEAMTTNTWVWLWTARDHFMKIRLTRRGDEEKISPQIMEFVEAMVRLSRE